MRVIGHRGAAGLGLENSRQSIKAAIDAGVDAVEIDVRLTKDKQLVLCHDADFGRVSNNSSKVRDLSVKDLRQIKLQNGEQPPLLNETLELIGNLPVIIELKDAGSLQPLLKVLEKFPHVQVSITSFKHDELRKLKRLSPGLPVYLAEHTKILDTLQDAKAMGADGLNLNFWLLNPLTYWLSRRAKLKLMVYTVNNRWLAWWLAIVYPKTAICTDLPNRLRPPRAD